MFRRILIANRGEIACRIIATCKRLGIATAAVYSEADASARHVRLADAAFCIGPPAARESYLVIERILEAARAAGADAIHPGYGFLSERAEFAEACEAAGLRFIGPPASAIRAMGLKDAAKIRMRAAGVPVVPGYEGDDQSPARLAEEAALIGWPLLIKAVAGGGGKGMRRVAGPGEFEAALAGARREAAAAFGSDRVLLEKYVGRPRHIEIQVFGDTAGNVVHLFERDCSVQRRHQKIIEEAPAPGMTAEMRTAMTQAAVTAAKAIGYVGAGTVEFIADGSEGLRSDRFYFMEMNTRLQVEHRVTEFITGTDLVEWQLRVAAGERLPLLQQDLAIAGHAVEARIYAEDPARNFLPSPGHLIRLRQPAQDAALRVDTGVEEGDWVTPHYDPMIAKLIVHGDNRAAALQRMAAALAQYEIAGVRANPGFLQRVVRHPSFAAGDFDTGFLERFKDTLTPKPGPVAPRILALAAFALVLERGAESGTVDLTQGGADFAIPFERHADGSATLILPQASLQLRGDLTGEGYLIGAIGNEPFRVAIARTDRDLTLIEAGEAIVFKLAVAD